MRVLVQGLHPQTNFQPFYRCLMKGTAGRLASQPFFSLIFFHSIHIILSIIIFFMYLFIHLWDEASESLFLPCFTSPQSIYKWGSRIH